MANQLTPRQNLSRREGSLSPTEIFERFQLTETKLALQKDGELTDISRNILGDYYDIDVPAKDPGQKRLVSISEDGDYGFVYARNKSICDLVASKAVDAAVVGTDRLYEDGCEEKIEVIASYEEVHTWPMVLAVPEGSGIDSPDQISRVATQYPRLAQDFLEAQGLVGVEMVPTAGSTELYPYLVHDGEPIEAVVDMCITGATLEAHGLVQLGPTLGNVYPVLIKGRDV